MSTKLHIIIPAYNEADSIVGVIKAIPRVMSGIDEVKIVVVDDGSDDGTVERVKAETDALVVSHGRNLGVGAAFRTGINYALIGRADLAVNIDADGQFDPADIPKLIKPLLNNQADLVTASRFIDKSLIPNMPRIKIWGNQGMAWLVGLLTGGKFYDVSCGFRAYNQEALLNMNLFGQFTYVQEAFLDMSFKGLRIREVPIGVRYFPQRRSRIYRGVFHYAIRTLKIILRTSRDYYPLKFFGSIGLIVFSAGLAIDFFMLCFFFQTGSFTPHKAVGLGGIFLNVVGLTILILALIADMLYRVRANQEKILYFMKKRHYYT